MVELSVVVPAYNEQKYIAKCLKSVLNQDFPRHRFEVIVVDDGSTDKTRFVAKKYADKVVTQKNSGTPAFSRNKGIKVSKGRIIVFLDADSQIISRNLFREIIKCKKKFIGGAPKVKVDTKSRWIRLIWDYWMTRGFKIEKYIGLEHTIPVPTMCCFYRKEALLKVGGFRNCLCHDLELWGRIKKYGKTTYLNNCVAITSDRKFHSLFKKMGTFNTFKFYLYGRVLERFKRNRLNKKTKKFKESEKFKKLDYFKR